MECIWLKQVRHLILFDFCIQVHFPRMLFFPIFLQFDHLWWPESALRRPTGLFQLRPSWEADPRGPRSSLAGADFHLCLLPRTHWGGDPGVWSSPYDQVSGQPIRSAVAAYIYICITQYIYLCHCPFLLPIRHRWADQRLAFLRDKIWFHNFHFFFQKPTFFSILAKNLTTPSEEKATKGTKIAL